MKLKVVFIVLSSLLTATAVHADVRRGFKGEAQLAAAVAKPKDAVIKGITWHCEGSRCSAASDDRRGLDNFMKQCRIVAKELGQLTKFRSGGRIATKGELSNCNATASLARKEHANPEALAKQ